MEMSTVLSDNAVALLSGLGGAILGAVIASLLAPFGALVVENRTLIKENLISLYSEKLPDVEAAMATWSAALDEEHYTRAPRADPTREFVMKLPRLADELLRSGEGMYRAAVLSQDEEAIRRANTVLGSLRACSLDVHILRDRAVSQNRKGTGEVLEALNHELGQVPEAISGLYIHLEQRVGHSLEEQRKVWAAKRNY